MEMTPGYKQSEVGTIPEDWVVRKLIDCLLDAPDYGINAPAVAYSDNLPVYIRITDIGEDGRYTPEQIVSVKQTGSEKYYLRENELVFARTGASVGKSYLYNPKDGDLVFAGFLIRVRPNPSLLCPHFLSALVTTGFYWNWVRLMSMRSGQPGINSVEYGQLPIPLPLLPEQRDIAAALSDTDALLSSLDRLLAKKRDIKQAVMQQLLTGKQRLPGFSGEWNLKEVKDLVQVPVTDGPHTTPQFQDAGIPFLSVNNIVDNRINFDDLRYISLSDHELFSKKCKPMKNDILLGKAASVGKVALVELEAEFNIWSPIALLRISARYSPKFFYYLFQSSEVIKQITLLTNSSSQGNLGMGDIEKIELNFPSHSEQTAIAAVLSDMDAEIDVLQKRRNKTRVIKQGMMQELLTGRTRLV